MSVIYASIDIVYKAILRSCLTENQVIVRSGLVKGGHNHGSDWGYGVVEMLNYQDQVGSL